MILHVNHLQPGVAGDRRGNGGRPAGPRRRGGARRATAARACACTSTGSSTGRTSASPSAVRRAADADGRAADARRDRRRPPPAGRRARPALRRALARAHARGRRRRTIVSGSRRSARCATASSGGSTDLFWQRLADWEAAIGPRLRGRHCRAAGPTPIIRRRSPIPSPTSGRCCAISTSAASCRRRSSRSRSASARARAPRSGSIASRRSTKSAARATTRGCASCSATTRCRRSTARSRPSTRHRELVSVIAMDALNPFKTLSFLRYKILYDPPDERLRQPAVRRAGPARRPPLSGRDARLPAPPTAAARIAADASACAATRPAARRSSGCSRSAPRRSATARAASRSGAQLGTRFGSRSGCARSTDLAEAPLPPGLDVEHLDDLLGGRAGRRTLPPLARRRGELRQHAAAAAPARVSPGAGHLRDGHGRVPAGLPRAGQAGRLGRDLGQRRAAARGRRARRLRRALRAVPLPPGLADVDSLHDASATDGPREPMAARCLTALPTAVVGSYSMPDWLERAKNDYLQRRISRHDLDEMHDAAVKAAIKDQEVAGVDIITDGELRRDNMIDYFAERLPGVQVDHALEALLLRLLRQRRPRPDAAPASLGLVDELPLPPPLHRPAGRRSRSPARTRWSSASGTSTTRREEAFALDIARVHEPRAAASWSGRGPPTSRSTSRTTPASPRICRGAIRAINALVDGVRRAHRRCTSATATATASRRGRAATAICSRRCSRRGSHAAHARVRAGAARRTCSCSRSSRRRSTLGLGVDRREDPRRRDRRRSWPSASGRRSRSFRPSASSSTRTAASCTCRATWRSPSSCAMVEGTRLVRQELGAGDAIPLADALAGRAVLLRRRARRLGAQARGAGSSRSPRGWRRCPTSWPAASPATPAARFGHDPLRVGTAARARGLTPERPSDVRQPGPRTALRKTLEDLHALGIENVFALTGDYPAAAGRPSRRRCSTSTPSSSCA